jgi:hypothetical protein
VKYLVHISILFIFFGCTEEKTTEKNYIVKDDGSIVYKSEGIELTLLKEGERGNVKNFEGVSFVFKDVSALDYLSRTGNSPSAEDRKELANESVFMLELVGHKPSGSIFENAGMNISEDDATKYLIGEIEKDFVIIQKDKRFKPLGVQYDGKIGNGQKIRVAFFMEGVNLNLPYTIEYYDRLFGKGLVKLTRKKTDLIS